VKEFGILWYARAPRGQVWHFFKRSTRRSGTVCGRPIGRDWITGGCPKAGPASCSQCLGHPYSPRAIDALVVRLP
jgi:hypothetical protein